MTYQVSLEKKMKEIVSLMQNAQLKINKSNLREFLFFLTNVMMWLSLSPDQQEKIDGGP